MGRKKKKSNKPNEDKDDLLPEDNEVKKDLKKKKKKKDRIGTESDINERNTTDYQTQNVTVGEVKNNKLDQQLPTTSKSEKKQKKKKKITNTQFPVHNSQDDFDGI